MQEYKYEFENPLKKKENEINHYWRQLKSSTMKGLKNRQNSKRCQEVKDIYGTVNNIENKNKDMYKTIEKNNTKMCNEIKKTKNYQKGDQICDI